MNEELKYTNVLKENLASLNTPLSAVAMWEEDGPYEWQRRLIQQLFLGEKWQLLVTPNEAGKTSWVVKNIGLAFMTMFPAGQVVSTAGSYRQIEEQLWPLVRAAVAPYPDWRPTDEYLKAPSIDGLPESKWTIFSTNDPGKAEGYHGRRYTDKHGNTIYAPLLYIIDEAKTVDDKIFEAMIRCDPDYVLVCSTPGEESGEFYNIIYKYQNKVGETRHTWDVMEVTQSDCPHLLVGRKRKVRESLIKERGINDPFVQSMVFGKFIRKGGFFIFNMDSFNTCASNTTPFIACGKSAGVELAAGTDEVVFALRNGNKLIDLQARVDRDTARASRWLESLFKLHGLESYQIKADAGGLGKPIIDELKMRGWKDIVEYRFDAAPLDPLLFNTKAMEDHWNLSMHMNAGLVSLPNDPKLKEQMRLRKYELPNSVGNRMNLQSKDFIRKNKLGSPDRLDAVTIAFSDMPDLRYVEAQSKENEYQKLMKASGWSEDGNDNSVRGMLCEN